MKSRWINSPAAYALGMFAMMVPTQAFSSFYFYYYVDQLGLALGLATIARTIYLIWDAVNQPMAGWLSDRTNTRLGRRRPWLLGAVPAYMLTFVMVFAVPQGLGKTGLFVWFLAALILIEAVATIIWVNYGALFPELFRGVRLRARASAVQQGFQIAALLIATAGSPLLYTSLGYGWMSVIYAVLFGILMLTCIFSIREREEARLAPKLSLRESFRTTLRNVPFWLHNIANSFAQTVNGLIGSIIPFYAKYVLRIPDAQVSLLLASIFVSVIPLVFVWYRIARNMDPVRSWRLALAAYAASVLPLGLADGLASGIAAGVLVGFGLSGFLVTPPIVGSRIIDLDFAVTGQRREGVYTAVSGFITRASGLISAVAFWIVGLIFDYESGDNPGPNPEAAFVWLSSYVPFGLLAIAFAISLFVRLGGGREEQHEG
ncbi:MAG: MFS transporter [Thermobacillus sp. ZCTH02-B1]|uniref:MFS transporter n=1 Tax=Thermobacillus sp. ZCTH02-B1 TaxID=1858795 RepID=UPI000B55E6C0|nr:MFS transporter [Thermobacillus sp. ZCTH02-B1]OUM94790.1 MAG: MFS transporter [Thermobacillus sp. ZCTH02-B1]